MGNSDVNLPPRLWSRAIRYRLRCIVIVTFALATCSTLLFQGPAKADEHASRFQATLVDLNGNYPIGITDSAEPSGEAPPSARAMVGYNLSYVTDFSGTSLPQTWEVYTGIPMGDPGGRFAASHVVVSGGLLDLTTFQDPLYGNRWITGGLCQCGRPRLYGAIFVRSRITGPGPSEIQLLWPANEKWPPEVDLNETGGSSTTTSSSLHYGAANTVIQRHVTIDMIQWHTWGVIWTPNSMTYTVDGRIWGGVKGAAYTPKVPMTLDLQQQQQCEEGRQCPTAPESMLVDWVAEYTKQ